MKCLLGLHLNRDLWHSISIIGYFIVVTMLLKIHYSEKTWPSCQDGSVRRTLVPYAEDPGSVLGPITFLLYLLLIKLKKKLCIHNYFFFLEKGSLECNSHNFTFDGNIDKNSGSKKKIYLYRWWYHMFTCQIVRWWYVMILIIMYKLLWNLEIYINITEFDVVYNNRRTFRLQPFNRSVSSILLYELKSLRQKGIIFF